MASIRRTLSPVPRPGPLLNGEACSVASPLSRIQAFVLGLFSQRFSRPLERSKPKGLVWIRALFHFLICFMVGVFAGLTPFLSMNLSTSLMSKHQAFSFEVSPSAGEIPLYNVSHVMQRNVTPLVDSWAMNYNATSEPYALNWEKPSWIPDGSETSFNQSSNQDSDMVFHKLLIIVTPTHGRPFQAYYLNRLAQTLKLVPTPLLWIVVEMASDSSETADILRRTGVMFRHLVCNKNLTDTQDRGVHQRNVALSHIETHRLNGIVYFADDDNIYSIDLFEQMRQIRRLGTWMVAKLLENKSETIVEGPICNGTQVLGWHTNEVTRRFRRFHAEMSGFAFNSTILWDPKSWRRPTLEPIRQFDTVKEGWKASTFIEQIVEDESQMEGLMQNCSRIMVWHLHRDISYAYPQEWFMKNNLDVITQLA
ncbi:probable beta-1,4-xylosyltransferase IRX9H isoform X2 [Cornus florida]|uniref:probable beta-1,4-xylosyltransferase IRX9H isoform X2 n=1 Tax=Cornus florida TaxID=4283 RepID=UPI0028965933|nr:probable beta-1,4-xylosyltransferase IRX9H isoform X2 [Cornus florida]